ncbi:MAG: arabinose transporter permease [Nocardioides sp.]|jgi:predicted MFS family arabinose efflux permease|nr:arabinose transporter permease [Nocardioides sp.]
MTVARNHSFRFGVTLTLMMGVGPAIMFCMSALGPDITSRLDLTRVEFGSLATVAYIAAVPGSLTAGRVMTVISPRRVLMGCFLLTSVALLLVGTATSMAWLVLAATLSGIIQSFSNPVTNLLVATAPGGRGAGRVMGVKQSGVQMAQLTAGLLPLLAVFVSWRVAVCALAPVGLFAIYLAATSIPGAVSPAPARGVARVRLPATAWWLFLYSFFVALSVMATNVYLPLFGVEEIGLGAALAGSTMILAGALGMLGRIGWGWTLDSLRRHDVALAILALVSFSSSAVFMLAATTGVPWLMWLGVALHGGGAVASNVVVIHALISLVGPSQVASASGYQGLSQYLGFAIGPIAYGALIEATDTYLVSWCAAGGSYLIALAIAVVALRRAASRLSVA